MKALNDKKVNLLFHLIGRFVLRVCGWRVEGSLPDLPKWICIVAPHTSNYDFFVALMISWALRLRANWLGKHTIFRGPVGWALRRIGGMPVERSSHHNIVDEAVAAFAQNGRMRLVLAPEGTRSRMDYWKSGFYHIALRAQVPLALGFLDFGRRVGGIGPVVHLTGNQEEDMAVIAAFYEKVTPRHPSLMGPVRLSPGNVDKAGSR